MHCLIALEIPARVRAEKKPKMQMMKEINHTFVEAAA